MLCAVRLLLLTSAIVGADRDTVNIHKHHIHDQGHRRMATPDCAQKYLPSMSAGVQNLVTVFLTPTEGEASENIDPQALTELLGLMSTSSINNKEYKCTINSNPCTDEDLNTFVQEEEKDKSAEKRVKTDCSDDVFCFRYTHGDKVFFAGLVPQGTTATDLSGYCAE